MKKHTEARLEDAIVDSLTREGGFELVDYRHGPAAGRYDKALALDPALVLAGAASLLAALLGWAVALCTARAAHKTLVTVAATLGLAVVYGLAYQRGMAQLEQVLGQAALGGSDTALTGAGRFLGASNGMLHTSCSVIKLM